MWLRQEVRKVPLRTYTLLAITTVATMGFSNASLGYLNYPTQVRSPEGSWGKKYATTLVPQVIFKCCKLIPVLVGGILIQGKKYGLMDFTAAGNLFLLKVQFNTTKKFESWNMMLTWLMTGLMCLGLIFFTLADSKVKQNCFKFRKLILIHSS